MNFALFIFAIAILFIRPSDFVPGLKEIPLFQIAIVPCILMSWHKLVPQLTTAGLRERPVLVFAIGILLVSIITSLAHGQFQTGYDFASTWVRIPVVYWLMLAQFDSPSRLKLFLGCLVGIILIPVLLAILHYHGYISIPEFEPRGDSGMGGSAIRRLQGTGNFGDPNDVCEILNCALIFSLYGLLDRGRGFSRVIWLAPLGLFGHALALTHSRGGFLGVVVGVMVLLRSRFRGIRSLVVAGAALTLMLVLFSGRQTDLDTSGGTSQERIQIWDAGFQTLRGSPLIGGGLGEPGKKSGPIAHNAFVGIYSSLGFLGGTLFFGQYFWCLTNLMKLASSRITLPDPEIRRLQPFVLASLASFATSEMSLTNGLSIVTYVMFGVATVFIRLADPSPPLPDLLLSRSLVRRIIVFSVLFLGALYLFIRLSVRYG
ncbi:MAG: O-antigen ligase family protein [Isosphaeraceae bacterium]